MTKKYNKRQLAEFLGKSLSWLNQQISDAPSCQRFRKYDFPRPDSRIGRDLYWNDTTIAEWLEKQTINRRG